MRILINILLGIMLVGLLAGAVWHTRTDSERTEVIEDTRRDLQRFERQIALRSALREGPTSQRGYPLAIDPEWFDDGLPQNHLLSRGRPWLEIADESQRDKRHPRDPVALHDSQAMFWYNPDTGVVRARIPAAISEAATIELYNKVNGTALRRW